MTAPFPTRRQEEWRYADLDALKPVWEQFAEPRTITVAAGESLEEVWLPAADDGGAATTPVTAMTMPGPRTSAGVLGWMEPASSKHLHQ